MRARVDTSGAVAVSGRTPSAIEERRVRRRRRRRVAVSSTVVGVVVLLAVAGAVSTMIVSAIAAPAEDAASTPQPTPTPTPTPTRELLVFPDDEPAVTAGSEPCTIVRVLSSVENAHLIDNLAGAYNRLPRNVAGSCVAVEASSDVSGRAADAVASGFASLADDHKPTVWLPDSSTWVDVAVAKGATVLHAEGTSIAYSHIVLAMPQPLAEAAEWVDDPPTWTEVFEAAGDPDLWSRLGHPEWGTFTLGKTSPLVATSGEAAMFASFGTAAGSLEGFTAAQVADVAIKAAVHETELATSHYMATPEHFLWHARQAEASGTAGDFVSAMIVDEKAVWDHNRGVTSRDGATTVQVEAPADELQLTAIYPRDGYYTADNPAMRLVGPWIDPVEAEAAADFIRFTLTKQGQEAVRASGYRDLNHALSAEVARIGNLAVDRDGTLAFPGADVVTAVQAAFPEVRKRANVLFLLDVSGSMDDPASDADTELAQAAAAIEAALDHFTAGDDVGLAAFAQAPNGSLVPGMLVAPADIAASRDALVAALDGVRSMGDTPLYQAVDRFTAQHAESWSRDRVNAVVLLSDGENDTPNARTIGLDEMLANLAEMHRSTPVLVFTLGYGADADVQTLQSISRATGAHYYDASDPSKLQSVLADLVTSF